MDRLDDRRRGCGEPGVVAPDTLDDAAERLSGAAFLQLRSGVLFSILSYLMVAGLVTVGLGFEQGENHDQLSTRVVSIGWCVVAVPVCGCVAMLWRQTHFLRAISHWVTSTIRQDPETAPKAGLESRLAMNSFLWGAFVFPPFGFICPFLALIAARALERTKVGPAHEEQHRQAHRPHRLPGRQPMHC